MTGNGDYRYTWSTNRRQFEKLIHNGSDNEGKPFSQRDSAQYGSIYGFD